MLPKTGKRFPGGNDRENGGSGYAAIVAGALAKELGDTHRAAKVLMGWTGAGERTVKHWLAGLHGPTGDHLLVLMQESDAVFEAILTAINRRDAAVAARMLAAQRSLQEVASLMQFVQVRPPVSDERPASGQEPESTGAPNDREMTVVVTVIMTVKPSTRVLDPAFGRAGFWRHFGPDAASARPSSRSDGASLRRRRGETSPV